MRPRKHDGPLTEEEAREVVKGTVASLVMEGLVPTEEDIEDIVACSTGKMSYEEFLEKTKRMCGVKK